MKCAPLKIFVFFLMGLSILFLIVGMATETMGSVTHNKHLKQFIGIFSSVDFRPGEGRYQQSVINNQIGYQMRHAYMRIMLTSWPISCVKDMNANIIYNVLVKRRTANGTKHTRFPTIPIFHNPSDFNELIHICNSDWPWHMPQGWFEACAQPMRDVVTM